ncbi:OmpA family protein [Pacificimonas sp. WHA3]|uniref:OmpA family protein n=1 Tax=Pacificimonas pallii TaxID=2827236 RepID=A0ABS6SF36_9SPHN|nr:flagellar motor protein MotB [Pacificimonas pallii]MBV7257023.1 OmpA family protein [Pacificimonas pallii]
MIELASNQQPRPIIVKKVIPPATEAHHGGAWKIAYADFVTAMMAFFLVMWIIGATSEDQRKGIADYFRPTLADTSKGGGANGLLAGRSSRAIDGTNVSDAKALDEINARIGTIDRSLESTSESQFAKDGDEDLLTDLRAALLAALAESPQLQAMADRFEIYETPAGVHLELIDNDNGSMFPVGSSVASHTTSLLLDAVSSVIENQRNALVIRGHTDARKYESTGGMSNWLLSVQRADTVRTMLAERPAIANRIIRIEGSADRELREEEDPLSGRNRRISVTLLY